MFECARCYETHILNGKLLKEIERLKAEIAGLRRGETMWKCPCEMCEDARRNLREPSDGKETDAA